MMNQKKFQELIQKRDIEMLMYFRDHQAWPEHSRSDSEILAQLFLEQGSKQLKEGNPAVFESLELAARAAPHSAKLFFDMAMLYSTQFNSSKCLSLGIVALEKTLFLDPNQPMALCQWGILLQQLGHINHDHHLFYLAQEKFNLALLLTEFLTEENEAYILWQLGKCFYYQGSSSGEAVDFNRSIELYNQVAPQFKQNAHFWNDLGEALFELTALIGKEESLFEVIEVFQKAATIAPDYFLAHFNLGRCYQQLYDKHLLEEYFHAAANCYENASKINAKSFLVWKNWGHLLLLSGRMRSDIERLEQCNEKFEKADVLDPNDVSVLSDWAEALMLCGAIMDQHELLRESESKIVKCLEIDSSKPNLWCIYGSCLYELARYFTDENLYLQAVEKLHYGISLDKTDPQLWYGLALTCAALGELKEGPSWLEKSITYYNRVLEFGGQVFPQFWNDFGVALLKLAELTEEENYLEEALDKFERAICQPDQQSDEIYIEPEWLYNFGCALTLLGDLSEEASCYEKAVQVFSQVIDIDPMHMDAQYNLASSLLNLGELVSDYEILQKAGERFQVILNEDIEDEEAWNDWGMVLLNLAELTADPSHPEMSKKYYHEAEQKFIHAIALGNTASYYQLACLYSMVGNYDASVYYIERAEANGVLPLIDDLMHDEWLEGVRNTEKFRNFISHLSRNYPETE